DKARLDDIAQEAGIAKGSIYHYFGSKQEIYERLLNNVKGQINFEAEMMGDEPASKRMEHLLRLRLKTTVEYPLEVGLLARELVRMEGPAGEWAREDPKRYLVAIRHIIIQGQKTGEFRAVDPDVLASTIFGILAHLPNWYRLSSRIQPESLVDEIIDFIMAGLLIKK
ncbi:MAG: TetR/AcrR family transcriptional regulator, partial [Pseudomonadota bacterium]